MRFLTLAALLPAALAIEAAEDAGGPQSPPTYTDTTGAPTVATVVTYSHTSSVAPLYSTTAPPSHPGSPVTSYPIHNGTTGYPTSAPGNLSTTAKHPSTSVVVATVTGPGGQRSTQTSVLLVTPSGESAPAVPQGTGSAKSGEGVRLQGGAAAALAVLGGFLAFMI